MGLRAYEILSVRYGRNAYKIDNYMAQYNCQIYSLDDFVKMDNERISIIICLDRRDKCNEFIKELKSRKIKAKIRTMLDSYVRNTPEKISYFKQIKDLCKVKECLDYELVRVGRDYDGGYIMPNDFRGGMHIVLG